MNRGLRRAAGLIVGVGLALATPGLAYASSGSSAVKTVSHGRHVGIGHAWKMPSAASAASPSPHLPELGGGASQAQLGMSAAVAEAKASGRRAIASALTTPTQLVTAQPDGVITATTNVLPVRVHQSHKWVPVNTTLRSTGGRLEPTALPGDGVSFSAGGSGAMAEISSGRSHLDLWWPTTLPAPRVAGATATYRNVLPGVTLVLTATSQAAGGFNEVLVVSSAAAAHRVARLKMRVTGVRLSSVKGGGLSAPFPGGAFVSSPARMWDSSSMTGGRAAVRTARAAALQVGAELVPPGGPSVSSAAAPASGARIAPLGATVSGQGRLLALVPDGRMLASQTSRFPIFYDPDFTTTGSKQDYDPVQSECTSSHWNSSSYTYSPVGYDNWGGSCANDDTDRALYRVAMPTQTAGSDKGDSLISSTTTADLLSANFQVNEVYSSDCSSSPTVSVSWIGAISSSTGWPGPNPVTGEKDATSTVKYDSGSCDNTVDYGNTVAASFNVLGDITAASSSATNMTFRLWENGNTNEDDHKQFSDNPDLQITYIDTPNAPSSLSASTGSSGSGGLDCDTTDPKGNASASGLPRMGKFDSNGGPYLWGKFTTGDTNTTTDQFKYWIETTSGTKDSVTGATFSGTGQQSQSVTSAFAGDMTDATVVAYQAQASITYSGTTYKSAWSSTCYFGAFPTDPGAPTVTTNFTQTTPQAVGTELTFTITQSSGDTASDFVWGLDQEPPTSGTIPAAQECSSTSSTCKLSGGTASVTLPVPSPGPHDFWVYELDTASNESGMTNSAPAGQSTTFDGSSDPAVSYTSGGSLAANFAAALGAKQSFDNTMISTTSGSSGTANGGGGYSFDEGLLKSAGWNPSSEVTVNGASFALPAFGSSTSGPDNLLAANQTIGAGSAGAQGNAVVFLATSTDANALVPGIVTGDPADGVVAGDESAPAVLGGTEVTGAGCSTVVPGDQTLAGNCLPASGEVNYASGCAVGTQTSYSLTAPDWILGPADLAAVSMPDRDNGSGEQSVTGAKIYEFAVPVDSACTITSVTLPDVGNSVLVPSGATTALPGLHIFGIAVRNTSTATPEVQGSSVAAPASSAWTAGVESPVENAFGPPTGVTWGNQTFREVVAPNVSAPAGSYVRIQLSDPGFLSGDGTGPIQIGAASIATGYYGAIPGQTPSALTFGGSASVTIPEGGVIYSDPLQLPFAVTAGKQLLVSIWIKNSNLPELPQNPWASGDLSYWASSTTPNETEDTTGTPFTGSTGAWSGSTIVLTGLDVTTSPADPSVVVVGDNVIDGLGTDALGDSTNLPSDRLAGQLYRQGFTTGYGVVDAGVDSNQVLTDSTTFGGVNLFARLDRDVLTEPSVGTAVIDQGLEDILRNSGVTASELNSAIEALTNQLNAFGITVIVGTATPCSGFTGPGGDTCSSAVDTVRTGLNGQLTSGTGIGLPNCIADFDGAVTNGGSTEALSTSPTNYDSGDHANLSVAGYAALAPPVNSCGFMPNTPGGF